MPNLGWKEAIVEVPKASPEPTHYAEIAEQIVQKELRTEVGATPANSVNATISMSLSSEGDQSAFVRISRGYYTLRGTSLQPDVTVDGSEPGDQTDETGLVKAFGMYWRRDKVVWTATPSILGQQQPGSTPIDFRDQRGVYMLHDSREAVYVGRTTDQPLGKRLYQHTIDRLNGRWDRFSWFGVYSAQENGALKQIEETQVSVDLLITTMEALLIEGLEPPQNRKRGDDFRAIEFLQVEDPQINKNRILEFIEELKTKL